MPRFRGKRVLKIQGGGELPFAKPMVENPCPAGEHAERIYFPEVDPSEANPLKRIARMKEAGNDSFEIAATEHNVRLGHITHGRQISRHATPDEEEAGAKGDYQHIKAVCIKCGQLRELDHAPDKRWLTECKNQEGSYGGSPQFRNNQALVTRGYRISYKVPESQRGDRRLETLHEAGFEVILVRFS